MESRKSPLLFHMLAASFFALMTPLAVAAIDDTDPNSPTPVILTYRTSTRGLAIEGSAPKRISLADIPERAFRLGSTVTILAAKITLMDGEGANAFRLYAQDASGHYYRFPVTEVKAVPGLGNDKIYAITAQLSDDIGFWPAPPETGDLLLQLTWRGMGSNRVRLALGQIGGGPVDDEGAVPTPPGSASVRAFKSARTDEPDYVGDRWSGDRMRLLEQSTFGPNSALDNRIRRIGIRTWLNEQFTMQYPDGSGNCAVYPNVADAMAYPCQPIKTENAGNDNTCDNDQTVPDVPATCYRDTYSMYQPQTWFFRQAYYGDAQLRHRVAWALGQIWVTSAVDIQQGRYMVEWHKILSRNAFGNYRTLMREMTLDPTMGQYLSMRLSTRNNPNENYAREIMQLFTIGLFLLNQDGTLKLDGQGEPIPTYDQNGVNNLTKVFTGWTLCNSVRPECPNYPTGLQNYIDPMIILNRNNHDLTAKTLLTWPADPNFPPVSTNIPACTGCTGGAIDTYANNSLNQALDNMYAHPNVAPFVCRTLIQHLVTSDPTPAYVGRVAAVFNANRTSPTQMQEVVKAILLDPEARGDVKTDPFYGKLREPVQYATNFLRAFNVRSADGASLSDGYIANAGGGGAGGRGEFNGMAQIPFFAPTVFNYFPPGYVVPGTTMNGPEFAILTTGTTIQRTNFMNRFVYTAIPIPVSAPNAPNGTSLDFSDLQALEAQDTTNGLLLDELSRRMLHSTMSPQMRSTISTACNAVTLSNPPTDAQLLNRVRMAVYLVGTSSQYQVQR